MKNFKHKLYSLEDVSKKLGISFDDLKKEFNECGIKVREDDKVTGKTLEYVLSGMTEGEYDWGNHLHLETGEAKGDIEWKAMRGNEWDETPSKHYHQLTLSGWASKLWVDASIIRNELASHGYKIKENQTIDIEMMSKVIWGIELHESREWLKTHSEAVNYTHEYDTSKDHYGLSEMALHLGVPATTLYSWMTYNKGSKVQWKQCKTWTCSSTKETSEHKSSSCESGACPTKKSSYGKATFLKAGVAATALWWAAKYASSKKGATCSTGTCSTKNVHAKADHVKMEGCETGTCSTKVTGATTKVTGASTASTTNNRTATNGKEIESWIVASGTPTKLWVFRNMHTGLAWGLLWFLAVPLLAGFFIDTKNSLETMSTDTWTQVSVDMLNDKDHGSAELGWTADLDPVQQNMRNPSKVWAAAVLEENTQAELTEKTSAPAEIEADLDEDVIDLLEHKVSTKNFIDDLVKDMETALPAPKEHGVALPSSLPATGA